MKRMVSRLALAALLLAGSAGASQNPGAVFLYIWPAARPTALAGAFTSIADDASAVHYNPGGLGFLDGTHATLMHANWLPGLYPGMYYEYAGLTHRFQNRGSAGLNIIYLTTGETDVINEQGEFLGKYTTFDVSVAAGYGFPVLHNLGVGFGAKFIYSFLVPDWVWEVMPELGIEAGGTGMTWALDFGVLYKPWTFLNAGLGLSNIGPNISYTSSGESDPLPRMLRLGVTYFPVKTDHFQLGITPEINKTLVGMFYDPEGTKTFAQLAAVEWRDAWKTLGFEGTFRYDPLALSARAAYFEDLSGARGGITVKREGAGTEHVSLWDALTRKNLGTVEGVGITFGGGIEYARFKFDLSVDQYIYDFGTNNYKFSFSYQF
ncbi:PorV/PorQ family protein [candidate division WOR-3 bacterium]|nr:PorV/PorQ family protein [candidate division WOR-3 bacterium]